ncbi:MAG: hypothetical protein JNJ54_01615 [Myxococcaceae bacterium]|nr:hypothetical protein [Myxococcaceae bacterium]
MRALLFLAPLLAAAAFLLGYGDRWPWSRTHPVRLVLAALVALSSAGGFLCGGLPAIAWSAVNLVLGALTASGIVGDVLSHNDYSGYGALVLLPLAGLLVCSQLAFAAAATWWF